MPLKLTPEPFRRDVLQQSERDAEESDEQVADSQGADKNIGGRLDRPLLHDDVEDQTVARQGHEEDQHVGDEEDRLGAVGQLGDVDQRLDVVGADELLAAQVVVAEHLLQPLGGDPAAALRLRLRGRCCHPWVRVSVRSPAVNHTCVWMDAHPLQMRALSLSFSFSLVLSLSLSSSPCEEINMNGSKRAQSPVKLCFCCGLQLLWRFCRFTDAVETVKSQFLKSQLLKFQISDLRVNVRNQRCIYRNTKV